MGHSKKNHICKYCSVRWTKHNTFCLQVIGKHLTFSRFAGRRLLSGYYSSACAAMCWGVGDSGCTVEGDGGHAGGLLMHCGRCNRSGRMCEVARCGVCYVCHSKTPEISSLDKQTLVNFFVQTDTQVVPSVNRVQLCGIYWNAKIMRTSSGQPRSTQSCR